MKRTEIVVFVLVMVAAIGARLYGLSWAPPGLSPAEALSSTGVLQVYAVHLLGHTPEALRVISALAGIFTVLGLYLLVRRLFDDWRIAATAAFLMATGFWHILLSRVGITTVLTPLCVVWGFYELYAGIETHRLWHWLVAGAVFGLGFYTSSTYFIVPLIIACALIADWVALHAAFSHEKYLFARHQLLGGVASMLGVMVLVIVPLLPKFSVAAPGDIGALFAGQPAVFWPIAALFTAGLLRTFWKFFHALRTRGHPGVVHTLLLSWFFIGLAFDAPLAMPAVYIIAALGIHWMYLWLERSYRHPAVIAGALFAFLFAMAVADANRYFVEWANDPAVADLFAVRSVAIAQRLNALPPATLKYVVLTSALSRETVTYLTDTGTADLQRAKNISYLTESQFQHRQYPRGAVVLRLDPQ